MLSTYLQDIATAVREETAITAKGDQIFDMLAAMLDVAVGEALILERLAAPQGTDTAGCIDLQAVRMMRNLRSHAEQLDLAL